MGAGLRFTETMEGVWRPTGADRDRPMRFEVTAETPTMLKPFGTVVGTLAGTLSAEGLAESVAAGGSIEISPVEHRRIRYTLEFRDDAGGAARFDGWKSIRWLRPVSTWTTLPGTLYDAAGDVVGTASLRFPLRDAPALLASARLVRVPAGERAAPAGEPAAGLHARRWDGRPGRLEVWYDTWTDPETGTGFWLHHELCSPTDPAKPAEVRGWAAVFPPGEPPVWERFGPGPVEEGRWFSAGDVEAVPGKRRGSAGQIAWDVGYQDDGDPIFTFPALTWRRDVLPGAQIVPSPSARFDGEVRVGERAFPFTRAPGAAARIYGHGNAARWAWLHADLGAGDVLEIVAAAPHRQGLDRVHPLPLVQLRLRGRDWPEHQLLSALRFACRINGDGWSVSGRVGNRGIRVEVSLPAEETVAISYADPDGSSATCSNSERATAHVVLERRTGWRAWQTEREWKLDGTAHAEIGTRP